ncbi:MAG: alanine:cation symporter family protein [Planctomycetota bacterium]
MLEQIEGVVQTLGGIFFSNEVVYALLATGVLYTVWTVFGQYRAITHGVSVVRGKYDDKDDPGAINHFQALSAALSATVGLGNIAGVAVAVSLGGPGAVLWMWVIGIIGMALKTTEVTQSMLYRNTDDPDNPHGGPMYVVKKIMRDEAGPGLGLAAGLAFGATIAGLCIISGNVIAMAIGGVAAAGMVVMGMMARSLLGSLIGGIFCVTLILSAITGGNMFQSFNVAEVTNQYIPGIPKPAIGVFLAIVVGLVIIGGIKRIGAVAGRIVPLMCAIYLLAGLVVLGLNLPAIPDMVALIFKHGLPGGPDAEPFQAFVGASFGVAAMWGIKRALFSSEAGQGSSPVAHSAAKTDEPAREGVVAGLEPFIDTLVVCTVTALIILSTGAWNREAEASFAAGSGVALVDTPDGWTINVTDLPGKTDRAKATLQIAATEPGWKVGEDVFMLVDVPVDGRQTIPGDVQQRADGTWFVTWDPIEVQGTPTLVSRDIYVTYIGAGLTAHAFDRAIPGLGKWLIILASWLFAVSTMISWSYYGEQGVYFLFGKNASKFVLPYKLMYCVLVFASTLPFIETEAELDMWTTLGLGAMLVANIPIMLVFGFKAMSAYHDYFRRMKLEDDGHEPPAITDVVEGKDVE